MILDDIVAHRDASERYEIASQIAAEVARRARAEEEHDEQTKRCPRCDTVKPLSAFGVHRTRPDGRQAYCRRCRL